MIDCREASLLCTKRREVKLTFAENIRLQLHLFICKPCKLFAKQIAILHRSIKAALERTLIEFDEQKKSEMQKIIEQHL